MFAACWCRKLVGLGNECQRLLHCRCQTRAEQRIDMAELMHTCGDEDREHAALEDGKMQGIQGICRPIGLQEVGKDKPLDLHGILQHGQHTICNFATIQGVGFRV